MGTSELLGRTHELFLQQRKGQLSLDIQFPLLPSETIIPQGHLNTSMVVKARNQSLYILRQQNQEARTQVVAHIRSEYEGVGFLNNPQNGFKMNSVEEQKALAEKLHSSGIKTPKIHYAAEELQVIQFLPDVINLSDLWLRSDPMAPQATKDVFTTIIKMHSMSLVAGDRWGPNELLTPGGDVYLIDFDIGIWGPNAKEFDLANLIYHTGYFVHEGNPQNLPLLKSLYASLLTNPIINQVYNKDVLLQYIKGYAEFFASDKTKESTLYYRWSDPQEGVNFYNACISSIDI